MKLSEGSTISVRAENMLQSIGVTITDVKERNELNGRVGRVVGADENRYHVSVQGQVLALTPLNVQLPRGARARIQGLQNAPHHNGKVGLITDVDHASKRYLLELDAEHSVRVRWDNVRL